MGVAAGDPAGRARCRRPPRPTRPRPTVDDHSAGERRGRAERHAGDDHRHRDRRGRRRGRRRRGLDRRRRDLAPGDRARAVGPTRGSAARRRPDHVKSARRPTTAATSRPPSAGHTSQRHVPVHAVAGGRDAGDRRRRPTRLRSSSACSSTPTSTATSPGSASTRARATPARTSATCGRPRGTLLARATFTGETRRAGSRCTSTTPVAVHGEHHLRRLVPRPDGRYAARRRAYFSAARSTTRRCVRSGDARSGGNGVVPVRRARRSRPTRYRREQLLGRRRRSRRQPRHAAARRRLDDAGRRRDRRRARRRRHGDLQRAGRPASVSRRPFALRDGASATVPATLPTTRPTRTATLDARRRRSPRDDLHRDRQGGQPASRTSRATRWPRPDSWSFTTAAPPPCPCTLWRARPTPGDRVGERRRRRRARREVPRRRRRLHHRRPLLQGRRATPAPTSATCGPAPARCSRRRPSPTRPPTGWQQVDFATPVAITAEHDLRRLVLRAQRPLRGRPAATSRAGVDTRRCTRSPTASTAATASSATARRRRSRPSFSASNYWVDVVFDTTAPPDTTPPHGHDRRPGRRRDRRRRRRRPSRATFSEAVEPATVTAAPSRSATRRRAGRRRP